MAIVVSVLLAVLLLLTLHAPEIILLIFVLDVVHLAQQGQLHITVRVQERIPAKLAETTEQPANVSYLSGRPVVQALRVIAAIVSMVFVVQQLVQATALHANSQTM